MGSRSGVFVRGLRTLLWGAGEGEAEAVARPKGAAWHALHLALAVLPAAGGWVYFSGVRERRLREEEQDRVVAEKTRPAAMAEVRDAQDATNAEIVSLQQRVARAEAAAAEGALAAQAAAAAAQQAAEAAAHAAQTVAKGNKQ